MNETQFEQEKARLEVQLIEIAKRYRAEAAPVQAALNALNLEQHQARHSPLWDATLAHKDSVLAAIAEMAERRELERQEAAARVVKEKNLEQVRAEARSRERERFGYY